MRRAVLVTLGVIATLSILAWADVVPLWPSSSVAAQQIITPGTQPQISKTVASDPKAMFMAYCASCHGNGAKGDGPVGMQLKTKPADLTRIAARNNGVFPEVRIRRFIEGLDTIPSHGDRQMPVWGPLFLELEPSQPGMIELRVTNLTNYLKSIQVK